MKEIWKSIKNYEGLYEVSSFGRIRSLDRNVKRGRGYTIKKGRILIPFYEEKKGYYQVTLTKNGKAKKYRIHRLVAETFMPNEDTKKNTVNHIDGNKLNNNIINLEWCTCRENAIHAMNNGLWHPLEKRVIDKSVINRFKWYKPSEIELIMSSTMTAKELANLLNRTESAIYHVRYRYKANSIQK